MTKLYLLLIFLPFSIFGQDTVVKKSFVINTKANIVYRGIQNPVKIIVPDAKYFSATGLGLEKKSENGDYTLSPGIGKDVKIFLDITLNDGSKLQEEQSFKILNIPRIIAKFNEQNCVKCVFELSKKEIENGIIEIEIPFFIYNLDIDSLLKVESFELILPKKKLLIYGNRLDQFAIEAIGKLKKGTVIYISNIRQSNPLNLCFLNDLNDFKIVLID